MKTLDDIKQMMAADDTAKATKELKVLLAKEPGNLQAKMLYGTCCQLLGDEETFKRIHDELAPEMEKLEKGEPQSETVSLWRKYHAMWLIVAGLIVASLTCAAIYYGSKLKDQMNVLYGGPMYGAISKETKTTIQQEKVFSREDEEACRKLEEQHRRVEVLRRRVEEEARRKTEEEKKAAVEAYKLYAAPRYEQLEKEEAARREMEEALRRKMEEERRQAEEAAKKATEPK